jgi:hypothetical protein
MIASTWYTGKAPTSIQGIRKRFDALVMSRERTIIGSLLAVRKPYLDIGK